MKRRKESIIFVVISIILIFCIFFVRAKVVGKSSNQVRNAVEFLNTLVEVEAINYSKVPEASDFKEIKIYNTNNSTSKYTVVSGNYGIDLDGDYNIIGFLDQNSAMEEKENFSEDKAIINAKIYLKAILDDKVKFNEVKTIDPVQSPVYTFSFYKYHKKYVSYSNEIVVQINKYTGKLVSYTGFSDNKVTYNSDIEIHKDALKTIANDYFKVLGLKGEVINNFKLGYFILEEGQAQLCYVLNFKIIDGEQKDKVYNVVVSTKDGTVIKHY